MFTEEQKIQWLENATVEQLIRQVQQTSRRVGILCERFGFFSNEVAEERHNEELCEAELIRRMK